MDTRKKILAVALVAALVGGVVGAFALRAPGSDTEAALAGRTWEPSSESTNLEDTGSSSSVEAAYRDGFNEGFASAREGNINESNHAVAATQRVYRNYGSGNGSTVTRPRYASTASNTYVQPRQRSFWDKHRDKLTVAAGAGGGAILGGLIGGRKGAAIGALAGGGGSALYTYKLRKKTRRY
ncbi:MAG: hypothetical protein ABIP75_19170 [Pyrinomonadaceae bacterium]